MQDKFKERVEVKLDASHPGFAVVYLKGDLDQAAVNDLSPQLFTTLLNTSRKSFVFDLSLLNFLNSEGIGFLFDLNEKLKTAGLEMVLCSANSHVLDVLKAIGLVDVVPYFGALEECFKK